jgi:hypothetical protein
MEPYLQQIAGSCQYANQNKPVLQNPLTTYSKPPKLPPDVLLNLVNLLQAFRKSNGRG